MVIVGFWLCAFREQSHYGFSAELRVVRTTASTLTLYKLYLNKRIGNSFRACFFCLWTGVWPLVLFWFFGFLEPDFPSDPWSLGLTSFWSPSFWCFLLLSFYLSLEVLSFDDCFVCSIRYFSITSRILGKLPKKLISFWGSHLLGNTWYLRSSESPSLSKVLHGVPIRETL